MRCSQFVHFSAVIYSLLDSPWKEKSNGAQNSKICPQVAKLWSDKLVPSNMHTTYKLIEYNFFILHFSAMLYSSFDSSWKEESNDAQNSKICPQVAELFSDRLMPSSLHN